MNRADRRKQKVRKKGIHKMTNQEKLAAMVKNGITPKDLDKAYEDGRKAALMDCGAPILRGAYAAMCIAANELHGFGTKRCFDLLMKVDDIITNALTSRELIDDALVKTGIELDFEDVYGHVRRVR